MPVSKKTREIQNVQPREGRSSQKIQTAAATATTTGRIKKNSLSTRRPAGSSGAEHSASDVSVLQSQPSQIGSRKSRMASMGGGHLDPEPVLRLVKSTPMLNKILASICKAEGLPSAGVKAELQNRICESEFQDNFLCIIGPSLCAQVSEADPFLLKDIRRYVATGDVAGFQRIKAMLEHPDQIPQFQASPRYGHGSYSPSGPSSNGMANNYNNVAHPIVYRAGPSKCLAFCLIASQSNMPDIQFKSSPFYTILLQLGDTKLCDSKLICLAHRTLD